MNALQACKRTQVIAALVEGASINSIVRMTGVSKITILSLLERMGCACAEYHCRVHKTLRITPAMEAGISDHVWSIDELVGLLNTRQEIVA